jgi:hypothetical protein
MRHVQISRHATEIPMRRIQFATVVLTCISSGLEGSKLVSSVPEEEYDLPRYRTGNFFKVHDQL